MIPKFLGSKGRACRESCLHQPRCQIPVSLPVAAACLYGHLGKDSHGCGNRITSRHGKSGTLLDRCCKSVGKYNLGSRLLRLSLIASERNGSPDTCGDSLVGRKLGGASRLRQPYVPDFRKACGDRVESHEGIPDHLGISAADPGVRKRGEQIHVTESQYGCMRYARSVFTSVDAKAVPLACPRRDHARERCRYRYPGDIFRRGCGSKSCKMLHLRIPECDQYPGTVKGSLLKVPDQSFVHGNPSGILRHRKRKA